MDSPGAHGILLVVCHQPCAGKHISESATQIYVEVSWFMMSDLQWLHLMHACSAMQ